MPLLLNPMETHMDTDLPLDHEVLITVAFLELAGKRAHTALVADMIGQPMSRVRRAVEELRDTGRLTCRRGSKVNLRCTGKVVK